MIDKIKKNIRPLSGSIFIALIMWFGVTTTKEYKDMITVPLRISRLPEGKTLLNPIPDKAKIEIKGSGQSLIALNFYDVRFNLELAHITSVTEIQLKDYLIFLDIPASLGLEVIEVIEPVKFKLEIDDYAETQKRVSLNGEVSVQPGYRLNEIKFEPDTVTVTGPESHLNKIDEILTEEIYLTEQKQSFAKTLRLISPLPAITEIDPDLTEVHFDIQRLVEMPLYDVPISIINVPSNLEVTAEPHVLTLRVKGAEKILQNITNEDIEAQIDFRKNFSPSKKDYAASIKTPEKVDWIESIPKTFKLKVRRK